MKDGSENAPSKDEPKGLSWTQSRLVRLSQGGSTGAQASVIGFALAGPIIGGFLIGYFIDQKFGTQYWVLIIGLLGVFGGFREMFALVKTLEPEVEQRTPPPGREKIVPKAPPVVEVDESPKPRLFTVPPPFEKPGESSPSRRVPQNADEVLQELMNEEKSDEAK
jgi:MFS family permease